MPLYLDDGIIEQRLCISVARATTEIKKEMSTYAVTPSLALSLIRKYFLPMLPSKCHQTLLKTQKASWESLFWMYTELISQSFENEPLKELIQDIAISIKWMCLYTTYPPREPIIFDNLEANAFLEIYRFLKIEIKHLRYLDNGKLDVFRSCKYCWRQPIPRREICVLHTASSKHIALVEINNENQISKSIFTPYKEAKRQKDSYDNNINKILTRETITFHESNFSDPILLPDKNIWPWLLERRPLVAKILEKSEIPIDDVNIINSLLLILHTPTNLTDTLQEPFIKTNQHIKNHPQLIWLMLLRTEAWLITRSAKSSNWGGKRRYSDLPSNS